MSREEVENIIVLRLELYSINFLYRKRNIINSSISTPKGYSTILDWEDSSAICEIAEDKVP